MLQEPGEWKPSQGLDSTLLQGCPTEFFYSPIPLSQEIIFCFYPGKIFTGRMRIRILLKETLTQPQVDLLIMLIHTILQEEKVHKSLEVNKEIKEFLIPFHGSGQRTGTSLIISSDAFQGVVPSVTDTLVATAGTVETIPVLRKKHHATYRVEVPNILLHERMIVRNHITDSIQHFPFIRMPKTDQDGITSQVKLFPPEIIPAPSIRQLHTLPTRKPATPKKLMIPPKGWTF